MGSGWFVSVLALERFRGGTKLLQRWHLNDSVLALNCFSILALVGFSDGIQAMECFKGVFQ